MTEPVFLVGLLIAGGTLVMTVKMIAVAITGRRPSSPELAQLRDELDQQAAALEDAQQVLASQNTQLAEIQERLDFAERMLAQTRDRPALRPGDHEA